VVDNGLRLELQRHMLDRQPELKSSCPTPRKSARNSRRPSWRHLAGPRDYGLQRRTHDLKLAQVLAGHADVGATANIYAYLDTSDLETALEALNEEPT
jgi:integrase